MFEIDTDEFRTRGAAAYAAGRPGLFALDEQIIELIKSVGRQAARPALVAWQRGYDDAALPDREAALFAMLDRNA